MLQCSSFLASTAFFVKRLEACNPQLNCAPFLQGLRGHASARSARARSWKLAGFCQDMGCEASSCRIPVEGNPKTPKEP